MMLYNMSLFVLFYLLPLFKDGTILSKEGSGLIAITKSNLAILKVGLKSILQQ